MARPAASSRSTTRRIDYLRTDRPRPTSASRWSRPMPRRRACGATDDTPDPVFTDTLELDLDDVEPSLAGPKRPQDRVHARRREGRLRHGAWRPSSARPARSASACRSRARTSTSATATSSSPRSLAAPTPRTRACMIAAGLVARKARREGPEAQAVGEDLARARLAGRHRLSRRRPACRTTSTRSASTSSAIGCTTCIGNSGPLPETISKAINDNDLVAAAVLSGNRNFEGRVNPDVRANYLASPPLVVAYALAGTMHDRPRRPSRSARQRRQAGLPQGHLAVERRRSQRVHRRARSRASCSRRRYADVFKGDEQLAGDRRSTTALTYEWPTGLDLRAEPALFRGHDQGAEAAHRHRRRAHPRPLRRFDHHRPHLARRHHQGDIPAGKYLLRAPGRGRATSTSTARAAATTR